MGRRGWKEGRLSETDRAVGRTNSRPKALSPEPGNPASQRGRHEGQEHRAGKQGGSRRGERCCLELTRGKRSQRGTWGVRGKQRKSGGVVSVWRQNNMQPTETGVPAEQTARETSAGHVTAGGRGQAKAGREGQRRQRRQTAATVGES